MTESKAAAAFAIACCLGMGWHASVAEQSVHVTTADDDSTIYALFLNRWRGKDKSPLNVADKAETPSSEDLEKFTECLGGNGHWVATAADIDLRRALGNLSYVRLVDEDQWNSVDPGELISKGEKVGSAVAKGMARGLLTLSAIRFDTGRKAAALKYSFVCGALCGTGGVVLFEQRNNSWVESKKRCGGWVS
jgi:hypothetical protein